MHLYLCFNENNLKPCKMFICVCMYASVYKFHSLKAMQDVHLCMYVYVQSWTLDLSLFDFR